MLNHVHIACASKGCHATITVHEQEEARLRRTGESFFCPAGHSNYFPRGKSEKDKRIEQLEGWVETLQETISSRNEDIGRYRDALLHDAQTCPFADCGYRGTRRLPWWSDEEELSRFFGRVWRDLSIHMEQVHGAEVPEPVEAVAE